MKDELNCFYIGGGVVYLLQSGAIHFNHTVYIHEMRIISTERGYFQEMQIISTERGYLHQNAETSTIILTTRMKYCNISHNLTPHLYSLQMYISVVMRYLCRWYYLSTYQYIYWTRIMIKSDNYWYEVIWYMHYKWYILIKNWKWTSTEKFILYGTYGDYRPIYYRVHI